MLWLNPRSPKPSFNTPVNFPTNKGPAGPRRGAGDEPSRTDITNMYSEDDLKLLDQFAIAALPVIIDKVPASALHVALDERCACVAYGLAQAMLEHRQQLRKENSANDEEAKNLRTRWKSLQTSFVHQIITPLSCGRAF